VKSLQDAANAVGETRHMPLRRGDLLIVDNNRWGHGRCDFERARDADGRIEVNPREVWSLTLD
jgi:hypothetical protein